MRSRPVRPVEPTNRTTPRWVVHPWRERLERSERGDTLVEVLLALVVLALAALALIIAFSTTIAASAQHRQLARTDTILATASQELIAAVENQPTLFTDACSTPLSQYPFYSTTQGFPLPAPYTTEAQSNTPGYVVQYASSQPIEYWNGTTFTTSCKIGAPQLITIALVGTSYTNSFVVDYPVGSSGSLAAAGGADHLIFLVQPGCGATGCYAGTALGQQPIVEVVDAAGNPVTTDLSPVILQISANSPSTGVLSGCQGNEILGVVTFSGCTLGSGGTYILTASDGALTPVDSQSFTVTAAQFALVFTTQPVAAAAGSPFSSAPAVAVENVSNGQVNTAWQGTVTFTSSGGAFTNCPNATGQTTVVVTVTNGVAAIPSGCDFWGGYFYNPASSPPTTATNYTMTAVANPTSQSDAALPTTSNAYFVTGPGPASKLSFQTSPTGVASSLATRVFPVQPVVQVEDWFGNVAINSSPSIGLAFSAAGETLSSCTYSVNHGTYTYSGCHGSAYGNGLSLVASGSGLTSATSASFNITGVATQLVFTTSPQAGASASSFTVQPILVYEDANGSVVTAATAAVSLSVSPSSGTLANCTNLVPNLGYVNVQNCTFAGLVGTQYTMTATGGGLTSAPSAPFSPTGPGPATQLVYTQQPVAGAADALLTTQPVIVVEDSAGNLVTTSTNVITLTPSSGSVLSNCAGLTAIGGTATVTNCTFGGVVGTAYTITASSGNLTPAVSQPISPTGPGPMSAITLVATSTGFTVTQSTTLTATLTDNFGNVETADSSTPVTFSAQGSSTGSVTGLTSPNDASGVAVDTVTGATAGTVSVQASASGVTSNVLALTVNAVPAITTTSIASIDDSETTYHQPITATGGTAPLSWSASGFPAGSTLAINASTGIITETGTNTATPGTYPVSVTVTDADGVSATQTFSLVVNSAPTLSPSGGSLSAATDGQTSYAQSITAAGGTGSFSNWTVTSGALPQGFSLNSSTGAITASHVAAPASAYAFTIAATDGNGVAVTGSYTLQVNPAPSFSPSTVPDAHTGVAYSQTITAQGGTGTLSVVPTLVTLPAGMNLSVTATTATLTGTTSATSGTFGFTLTATDANGVATQTAYTFKVTDLPIITAPASLASGEVGVAYPSTQFQATSGTGSYTWSATGLPSGLSMSTTGVLRGTPTAAGTFSNVVVKVTDSANSSSTQTFTLVIASQPSISTSTLPSIDYGQTYPSTQLQASGGTGSYTWTATGLPSGLALNPASGVIGQTSTVAQGTYSNVKVTVTDALGATASRTFTLRVYSDPTISLSADNSSCYWYYGTFYCWPLDVTFSVSGGTGAYTWSNNPQISGLQIDYGPYLNTNGNTQEVQAYGSRTSSPVSVTVSVTDSNGYTATYTYAEPGT